MKQYRAIFFDWDGTAVLNRKASADAILPAMASLLDQGVRLFIISGTTYENILDGTLHERFTPAQKHNLYLGLARGAYQYGFPSGSGPELLDYAPLPQETLLAIHRAAYALHELLLTRHELESDIVFSRPNYCKLDFMIANNRGDKLFMQENEVENADALLRAHGLQNGVKTLIQYAEDYGKAQGLPLRATSDMKYLELGLTTKSDNVDYLLERCVLPHGISVEDCCFWGDEFIYLADGVAGSDAQMITRKSLGADFFDVSDSAKSLPDPVKQVGGGIETFRRFLTDAAAAAHTA